MKTEQTAAFIRGFELQTPVMQAPMGGIAGARLVAAAANAGALGNLPIWFLSAEAARKAIRDVRARTSRPFAVNLRADLDQSDLIKAAAEEGVRLFHLFWGDARSSSPAVRKADGRLIATVADRDQALAALDAGAEALIAQGVEAGGHVYGTTPIRQLVREVAEAAGRTPVLAAGGVVSRGDVAEMFGLGAAGVVLGTCLVVTEESEAHPDYRRAILDARAGDTVLSECFDGFWPNAPHRTLINSTYRMWRDAGFPSRGARPGEQDIVMRGPEGLAIPRYHASTAGAEMTGDVEAAALYAGTGVGRIGSARSVAAVLDDLGLAPPRALGATR
ncbi:MAG: hypothetical protein ABS77_00090 [Phenylobacterium sp. SCN 69-14]|nr:MAG: hypothetical protein ABS77_00090 [Phenylobacterium sp. SCN 69-14]